MSRQIYLVGGAVRDSLLAKNGIPCQTGDRDWVVVGATPQEMTADGFLPVGADFPVFLHPQTHEEYALARTERKTAKGYHGFSFYTDKSVTLTDDLKRRDLTINAMAMDSDGRLIDPYGGEADIRARVLRHVSGAFSEDPVRILRLARFAARLPEFSVAAETQHLMESMVQCGETDALVAERIWAEISRGLMEKRPSRMLQILANCGYWTRSHIDIPLTDAIFCHLDQAAKENRPLPVRAALLFSGVKKEKITAVCDALRVPADIKGLCTLLIFQGSGLATAESADDYSAVFSVSDPIRRPERFADFCSALQLLHPEFDVDRTRRLVNAFCGVNAATVVRSVQDKKDIPSALLAARRDAVQSVLNKLPCA